MKKLIILAAAMLMTAAGASAQTYFNIGAGTAGKVIAIEGLDPTTRSYNAAFAGMSHNFVLIGNFGIEAGFNYYDSFLNKDMTTVENSSVKYRCNGLMAPVEFNYKFKFGKLLSLGVYAGTTFHYGFVSTTKTVLAGKEISNIDSYKEELESRFVAAYTAAASIEVSSFRVKVSYQYGRNNVDLTESADIRRNLLSVSLGYAF